MAAGAPGVHRRDHPYIMCKAGIAPETKFSISVSAAREALRKRTATQLDRKGRNPASICTYLCMTAETIEQRLKCTMSWLAGPGIRKHVDPKLSDREDVQLVVGALHENRSYLDVESMVVAREKNARIKEIVHSAQWSPTATYSHALRFLIEKPGKAKAKQYAGERKIFEERLRHYCHLHHVYDENLYRFRREICVSCTFEGPPKKMSWEPHPQSTGELVRHLSFPPP